MLAINNRLYTFRYSQSVLDLRKGKVVVAFYNNFFSITYNDKKNATIQKLRGIRIKFVSEQACIKTEFEVEYESNMTVAHVVTEE